MEESSIPPNSHELRGSQYTSHTLPDAIDEASTSNSITLVMDEESVSSTNLPRDADMVLVLKVT
jgi:hypothetical protein